jgi:hypothetical protein
MYTVLHESTWPYLLKSNIFYFDGGIRLKNHLFRILTVFILASLVLSSCTTVTLAKSNNSQSTLAISSTSKNISSTTPNAMKEALKMSNQQWLEKLSSLDCNVVDDTKYDIHTGKGGDFAFDNSKNISSESLFVFFSYVVQEDKDRYPGNYWLKWYNKKEDKLHISVTDIIAVLNTYFNGINFDPTKIYGYNARTNTIDRMVDGFGGVSFCKFVKKQIVSSDTLRVIIKYFTSDNYKIVRYTKEYTIKYTDTGYKYLSITKS